MTGKLIERESFVLVLRPLPGVDGIRALRFGLKALKRHGLRAIKIEQGPAEEKPLSLSTWKNSPALEGLPPMGSEHGTS